MRTREEVTGEWRKLHYVELHVMNASPNFIWAIKSRITRRAGHVARMGKGKRSAYWVLVGRPNGSRPLERPRRRREGNIKKAIQEVGCGARTGLIWLRTGTGGENL